MFQRYLWGRAQHNTNAFKNNLFIHAHEHTHTRTPTLIPKCAPQTHNNTHDGALLGRAFLNYYTLTEEKTSSVK